MMVEWPLLIAAAFCAGIINSIAGGGSFLTLPALIFTGVPPVAANATSAVAVFPGYLGAVAGFRHELSRVERSALARYLGLSFVGGFAGSLLLLATSDAVFSFIVPWLLLFATLLFAVGERILAALKHSSAGTRSAEAVILFSVSLYGGYFNGGLGIVLLAALLFLGFTDLSMMNGLKNGISFAISVISVATFSIAGIVCWREAMVMMAAATAGGYYGAVVAKRIPVIHLKRIITAIGLVMSIIFFSRM